MKSFSMSKYGTLEHLLAAKAAYYEKLSLQLLSYLCYTGHVSFSDGQYYWKTNGKPVGEEIEA